jgi:predicted  nucleic acid-binding Zn-ribbon protein
MSDGVLIKYDELRNVDDALKAIVTELKEASSRTNELEDAIDKPWGESKLKDAAHEFEGGWNDRRNALLEDIEKVQQHVAGVLDGFEEWDSDTANEMESAE